MEGRASRGRREALETRDSHDRRWRCPVRCATVSLMTQPSARHPLDPSRLLPTTSNPAIDNAISTGLTRVTDRLLAGVDPALRRSGQWLWDALAPQQPGVTVANPAVRGASGSHDTAHFAQQLANRQDGVYVVLGRRGSGKTAWSSRLAQLFARPVYSIGMAPAASRSLGFNPIAPEEIDDLPSNCVVLLDDVTLVWHNRNYSKGEGLQRAIIQSRHKHQCLIANAHSSNYVNVYLLDATAVFLKPSSRMTADLQRSQIKEAVGRADKAFRALSPEIRQRSIYALSDELDFEGMMQYRLPRNWSQSVSEHHGSKGSGKAGGREQQLALPAPKGGRKAAPARENEPPDDPYQRHFGGGWR